MNIKELILTTEVEDVIKMIECHYGNKDIQRYRELYYLLLQMQPEENTDKMMIFIRAFMDNKEYDEAISVKEFEENDESLYFDVSAVDYKGTIYSIASANYKAFLGYLIEDQTLACMSGAAILAHCFFEITAYSFDDNI